MDKSQLHLNADLGEGTGNDVALMPYLEMCNIACAAHAGSPEDIEDAIRLAQHHEVRIGAHPSYPDKENFGRKVMDISEASLYESLDSQLSLFKSVANKLDAEVFHIKAHGALYHEVLRNEGVRNVYLSAIENHFEGIKIIIPSSYYNKMSNFGYHTVLYEAFADRQYMPDLKLMSRENTVAVLTTTEDLASQLHKMLDCGKVFTSDGSWQDIHFNTICVHGDTNGIVERLPKAIALLKNHNY
jgi:UPF0271 protein